jgi:hypothetical protein
MKELEKELKELKGFSTVSTNPTPPPPRASFNQRIHMEQPMTPAAYVAEDDFVGHQWEEWPLVLCRVDAPV